ncbi:TATA box-binding protein-associated factor RNA polymerase I subunit B-like [Anopheles albimanus]|uniref:TATA box-binding protein-associated factor RNA polymerase I subunit B n=1 Tax=Anopheles albimanus TaxID=7167 RepID=A0A182FAN4_ANOAL|nr:TATA box-binding protein-associated factor RNA polymerase I subunit B-like [Anopheles albimanus]
MNRTLDVCEVCGLDSFTLDAGFYYCDECGTKLAIKCETVNDHFDDHDDGQQREVKQTETKHQISSWEQLNYILHGLTERLIELGAPAGLKRSVLQIWCGYLQKAEIAFFDKRKHSRPRLSLLNQASDLKLIFNRSMKRTKKSPRIRKDAKRSEKTRKRRLNQQLLEEEHSLQLLSQQSDLSTTLDSLSQQSTLGDSKKPLSGRFNKHARKRLLDELHMDEEHVTWHEMEAPINSSCHSISTATKSNRVPRGTVFSVNDWTRMNRRSVLLAILALGLNHVGSSIMLSDLWRWHEEGHLYFHDIKRYLPDSIDPESYSETISHLTRIHCSEEEVRKCATRIVRNSLIKPRQPDLAALCLRYLGELVLPYDLMSCVTKLITISPPRWASSTWNATYFPNYEISAMQYILCAMKLLFALDGATEDKLDTATKKLNDLLLPPAPGKQKPLFVWSEWQRYVAMRRIILDQMHFPTHYMQVDVINGKPTFDSTLFVDFMESMVVPDEFETSGYRSNNNNGPITERRLRNLHSILSSIAEKHQREAQGKVKPSRHYEFDPSMQPRRSYMKEILAMNAADRASIYIPAYMWTDHSERVVAPFVNPVPLKKYLLRQFKVRLVTKRTKPIIGHIQMEKYCTVEGKIERYIRRHDLIQVLLTNGDHDNDGTDDDPSITKGKDILDYLENRITAKQQNKDELLRHVLHRNAINDLALAYCLTATGEIEQVADTINPFEGNPPLLETLEGEETCASKVHIALPSYHYWTRDGSYDILHLDCSVEQYFSSLPASFLFLLKEAAAVASCPMQELYHDLRQLEERIFRFYDQIK